jgi:hypothetical protein
MAPLVGIIRPPAMIINGVQIDHNAAYQNAPGDAGLRLSVFSLLVRPARLSLAFALGQ